MTPSEALRQGEGKSKSQTGWMDTSAFVVALMAAASDRRIHTDRIMEMNEDNVVDVSFAAFAIYFSHGIKDVEQEVEA